MDEIIELHQRVAFRDLKLLMVKLYRRNPNQQHDRAIRNIEQRVDLSFAKPIHDLTPNWQNKSGTDIINLAFENDYTGDRVFAFITGLRKMLLTSYDNHTEFYYLTSIDEQKLYNSARNIEIATWLLAQRKDDSGNAYILSDSLASESRNLSYQRLIGKIIATQDNIAEIVANKEGRLIKTFVVRAASAVFLPI